jgi:hypothetical protein
MAGINDELTFVLRKSKRLPRAGFGVFTLSPIEDGTTIGEYTGEVLINRATGCNMTHEDVHDLVDPTDATRWDYIMERYNGKTHEHEFIDGHPMHMASNWISRVNSCRGREQQQLVNIRIYTAEEMAAYTEGEVTKGVWYVADAFIPAEEELICDYGELFWKDGA